MIRLTNSYSKTLPVPGQEFSSQRYHCAVECELSDGLSTKEVKAKIEKAFATVRDAVEAELRGEHRDVAVTSTAVNIDSQDAESGGVETLPPEPEQQRRKTKGSSDAKATTKQIKFITDLAGRRGLTLDKLDETVESLFHVHGIYELDRRQASNLVDQLKAA